MGPEQFGWVSGPKVSQRWGSVQGASGCGGFQRRAPRAAPQKELPVHAIPALHEGATVEPDHLVIAGRPGGFPALAAAEQQDHDREEDSGLFHLGMGRPGHNAVLSGENVRGIERKTS